MKRLLLQMGVEDQIGALVSGPGGSYLIYGPVSVGKMTLALDIARRLNCEGCTDGSCRSCKLILTGNHPDIIIVSPNDKGKIGIESIQQLQHSLTFGRYQPGARRLVIIEDSHTMTHPAQNALLKTLEEPAANTMIILTATDKAALLATILSRCQTIFVGHQSEEAIAEFLKSDLQVDGKEASNLAALADGSIGLAIQYHKSPEQFQSRQELEDSIRVLLGESMFDRMIKAAELSGAKINADIFSRILASKLKYQLGSGPSLAGLEAVQRFRERLNANVNIKTAYEALALELPC